MKIKLVSLALLLTITATLILTGCGDNLEPITHTGTVLGFIPATDRGIAAQSNWYFVCFADGTEYYVFGKPEIVLGEEITVTFTPRPKLLGGYTITKVTEVLNEN